MEEETTFRSSRGSALKRGQSSTAQSVQVLDISLVGVLLHASRRIDPGTRGCLRLNLWELCSSRTSKCVGFLHHGQRASRGLSRRRDVCGHFGRASSTD